MLGLSNKKIALILSWFATATAVESNPWTKLRCDIGGYGEFQSFCRDNINPDETRVGFCKYNPGFTSVCQYVTEHPDHPRVPPTVREVKYECKQPTEGWFWIKTPKKKKKSV
jgi:hypothetical protein